MCKCTPNIRTPWCGRGNCNPPKPEGARAEAAATEAVKRYVLVHDGYLGTITLREPTPSTEQGTQYVLATDFDRVVAERDAMEKRLEVYATTESGERVRVPDGIECRDETIRLLEGQLAAIRAQRSALAAAADAAMQVIGELSPTQARVEVARMLQEALAAMGKSP